MNTINQKHQLLKIRLETTKTLIPFKGVINSKREIKAEKKLLIKELYKRVRNLEKELEMIETKNRLIKDINRINDLINHTNFDANSRELIADFFINKQKNKPKKNIYIRYNHYFFHNKYTNSHYDYWLAIDKLINKRLDNIFFIGKSIKDRKIKSKIHNKELVYNLELNNIFFIRKSWSKKRLMGMIMKM